MLSPDTKKKVQKWHYSIRVQGSWEVAGDITNLPKGDLKIISYTITPNKVEEIIFKMFSREQKQFLFSMSNMKIRKIQIKKLGMPNTKNKFIWTRALAAQPICAPSAKILVKSLALRKNARRKKSAWQINFNE